MYRGYKISIDGSLFIEQEKTGMYFPQMVDVDKSEYYEDLGRSIFADVVNQANDSLLEYISEDGFLEGDAIQDAWFPKLKGKFDVFISHSHNDEDLAFAFAGWLNKKFKLRCFLDKYVWNSADGLIRKLDDLCRRPEKKGYDYKDRNMTTSQVHAMLTAAIMQEIDDCDALFLLNTPEAVNVIDEVHEYTLSPWIFLEIGFSKLVEKKWNNKTRQKLATYSVTAEATEMLMELDTSHLTDLNDDELQDWLDVWLEQINEMKYEETHRWGRKSKELDPLIILDGQHKLPSKGPEALYD